MIEKQTRLNKNIAKKLQLLSHYKFQEKLKWKAINWSEGKKKNIIVNEAFTSKTCGNCGEINKKLSSNKVNLDIRM